MLMQANSELTVAQKAAQKLLRAHVGMMKSEDLEVQLLAGVSAVGDATIISLGDPLYDEILTAATDGLNEFYNADFLATLNEQETLFVIFHERFHKYDKDLLTLEGCRKKNCELAGMAADYGINLKIVDLDPTLKSRRQRDPSFRGPGKFLSIPEGVLLDDSFRGLSKIEIFNILWEENKSSDQSGDQPGDQSGDQPGDGLSDKILERQGGWIDNHRWQEGLTPEEKVAFDDEIRQRIIQGNAAFSKLGGSVSADVLSRVVVETPWPDVLAELWKAAKVKGEMHTTFRRFNKRLLAQDIFMPTYFNEEMGAVLVLVDTSGSVSSAGKSLAMSEIQALAEETTPESVDIVYWSTKVECVEHYAPADYDTLVESSHPPSGGGTSPECALQYIIDKQQEGEYNNLDCVIVLTDGYFYGDYGDWSELELPVIWGIIDGDNSFEPDVGTKLIIKSEGA